MNILSIQSWVAYGHVGNAAATFPLQRLGAEVWAVNTVNFSNHPGYGDWTGRAAPGAEIAALIDGIERRGAFGRCDAVLSGYMGDESVAGSVLDAVGRVRSANPRALYCCDPVIGDGGRVYVKPEIPGLISELFVPAADLLTPNQFELERLAGSDCHTADGVRRAIAALQARMREDGPGALLLTSAQLEAAPSTPEDALDIVAADRHGIHTVRVPRLSVAASGAGDVMAALFLFHFLRTGRAVDAMVAAAGAIHGILRHTAEAGSRDLLLIDAQAEIVAPSRRFQAEIF